MLLDYFFLAWNNLIHKKLRSWLTITGIFIGVVAVVSLISLGDGLKTAVNSQFGISSTQVISVQAGGLTGYGPPGSGAVNPLTTQDADAISKLDTVDRVVTRNVPSIKVQFNNKLYFGFAVDIPDGSDRKFVYDQVQITPLLGRMLKDGDNDKVMLGYNFYSDTTRFGKNIVPGKTIVIQGKNFDVVGVMQKKGSFIFDNVVYMNRNQLKDLMGYADKVDVIGVLVKDKSLMDTAKEDIEKLMRKRRDVKKGEEDFIVSTPQAALAQVNSILTGVQVFIVLIASISIFVGAIGIVNTMTTAVLERTKQIGIMKSVGAQNRDIFYLFFIESGLMGLFGGLLGVIVGVTMGYFGNVFINNFVGASAAPSINFPLIIFTLFGSFIIGSVAGILPALNAAKKHPVDALRK